MGGGGGGDSHIKRSGMLVTFETDKTGTDNPVDEKLLICSGRKGYVLFFPFTSPDDDG